ncbi:MAG TPA: efflux RND transporter periplasmic adaptor subunit [Arenimonas sp.]|nr:efflux RND transporter periplasmic adaptor subunit [Arenimonas sp.]
MIRDTSAQDRPLAGQPAPRLTSALRWSAAGIGAVGLFAWGLMQWADSAGAVSAEQLRVAEVSRGTLVRDASVDGRVVAAASPTLYAPAAGTVTLRSAAGAEVQRGELLAVIDSPELRSELERERRGQQQLEAELARQRILAQKAALLAQREADEAEIARVAALRDWQRADRGFALGAIAAVDHLRARDALDGAEIRARHAAKAAELETRDVALGLQSHSQQLDRQRLLVAELERRVAELEIKAPFNGIIGTLSVADRAAVIANTPLLTVVDLSRLEVELSVPESLGDDLGLGMAAEVRIGNQTVAASVAAISPEVVGNQVLVRARFEGEQPPGLRQNQRIAARILFEEKPDVLLLARGPFFEQGGGRHVYVVEDGIAVRRPVRLGASSIAAIEVLDGLQPGERVVIAGSDRFGEHERVAIH